MLFYSYKKNNSENTAVFTHIDVLKTVQPKRDIIFKNGRLWLVVFRW